MNVQDMVMFLLMPTSQIALIIALAEVVKTLGCPTKFIPLVDLVLGLISGIGVYTFIEGMNIGYGIVLGIALGLSACGLFSGIKNLKGD